MFGLWSFRRNECCEVRALSERHGLAALPLMVCFNVVLVCVGVRIRFLSWLLFYFVGAVCGNYGDYIHSSLDNLFWISFLLWLLATAL